MKALKLVVRGTAALAVLGLAAPAFPCTDMRTSTAKKETATPAKDTVASKTAEKSAKEKSAKEKGSTAKKTPTATN